MADSLVNDPPSAGAGGDRAPSRQGAAKQGRGWLARLVFGLDARLRRRHRVFEYTDDPNCIFRMRIAQAEREIPLRGRSPVRVGERIVEIHLWNEQVPSFPPGGASLAWARGLSRALELSLRELASYLARRPDLADVKAIRADMALGTAEQDAQLARISGRFGFEPAPRETARSASERLHRLGENVLVSLFVLARNPRSLRRDTLLRSRTEVVLARDLLDRYGESAAARRGGNTREPSV